MKNAYDELNEESLKMTFRNSMLKKIVSPLNIEINELKSHANKQKLENDDLNNKAKDLTSCLEKFTQGQKNLNLFLGSQRCVYDRARLRYNPLKKQKLKYQNSNEYQDKS